MRRFQVQFIAMLLLVFAILAMADVTAIRLRRVENGRVAAGSISSTELADSAVTSAKIANGTIVDADVNASAAVAQTKIAKGTTWTNTVPVALTYDGTNIVATTVPLVSDGLAVTPGSSSVVTNSY